MSLFCSCFIFIASITKNSEKNSHRNTFREQWRLWLSHYWAWWRTKNISGCLWPFWSQAFLCPGKFQCFSRIMNFDSWLKWIQSITSALKIQYTPGIGIKSPLNNYLISPKDQYELNWYLYSGCFISQSLCLLTSSFQKHLYNNQPLHVVTSSRFKIHSMPKNISRTCVHQWSHWCHHILQARLLLLKW